MSSERIQKDTTNNTPFIKMSEEVGDFDPQEQFINRWNGMIRQTLTELSVSPIDEGELRKIQIENGLGNREWEKQFVDLYVYGIYASAAEIGDLAKQFVEDKDGLGVDNSIRGAVELFSEIFGIKKEIAIEPLEGADSVWGLYEPGRDTLWFNFEKAASAHEHEALGMVAEMIPTIAHELWHAHQDEISDSSAPTLRRVVYGDNFVNYTRPDENYHSYRDQLIEDEAHEIGIAASEVVTKIFPRNEEAFMNNKADCDNLKKEAMQIIRSRERKFEALNL